MNLKLFILLTLFSIASNAQVGINTTEVSIAAVLHIEALRLPTASYGGLQIPVVTEAQKNSIPVSTSDDSDDGLMVFVSDTANGKQCWEIYDGVVHLWRKINCFDLPCGGNLYSENFESYSENTGITGASADNGDYPNLVNKWRLSSYDDSGNGTESYPGTLEDAEDYAKVVSGQLEIKDAGGPLLFETSTIDIFGYDEVTFSITVSESGDLEYDAAEHTNDFNCGGFVNNDYVDVLYSTDGGDSFNEVPNYNSNGNENHTLVDDLASPVTVTVNGITGDKFILRVRLQNNSSDEFFFLDNINIDCN